MVDFHKKLGIKDYDFRTIIGTSGIEFDPNKDKKNIDDHGYSLEEAASVFTSWTLLLTHMYSTKPYIRKGEIRQSHIAPYKDKIVHITTTMRKNESIRVISMRPAKKKERKLYEDSKYISFYLKP